MDYTTIANKIKNSDNFLIVSHISPDADAIGSSSALALALKSIGKQVSVYYPEPLPFKFSSLVDHSLILKSSEEFLNKLSSSVLIGVDCATAKRLGSEVFDNLSKPKFKINIDHHASNESWADLNYVNSEVPATAVMIYQLCTHLNSKISVQAANLMFAGLMDDTGSFRYSNTNKLSFEVAGELITLGANPADIANLLYFQVPERVLRLRALSLSTLEVFGEGQIGLIHVTNKLLQDCNCTSEDTEGLIDLVRSIEGLKLALFLREMEPRLFKGSARSKHESVDVNKFSSQFGGGGHKAAAGFTLSMTLDEALTTLRAKSIELLS